MAKLRATTPTDKPKGRLKALFFGDAGVGKTTAAIAMPKPYILDCESGTGWYGPAIQKQDGAVLAVTTMREAIDEVRTLMTVDHDFLTVVVDPFTLLYDQALEEGIDKVGDGFSKHFGYANKLAKRLYKMLATIDMNVICICHNKAQYDKKSNKIDDTYDGWKRLIFLFDLALEIQRNPKNKSQRFALVRKTRIDEFPDGSKFVWSYSELEKRLGKETLDRRAEVIELATEDEIAQFIGLYHQLTTEALSKLKLSKVVEDADQARDLPRSWVVRGIEVMQKHLKPETVV